MGVRSDSPSSLSHTFPPPPHTLPQADLVAQFLCSIPLDAIPSTLAWLRPHVPPPARRALATAVAASASARPGGPLADLLAAWLGEGEIADADAAVASHTQLSDACGSCAGCAASGLARGTHPSPLPPPSPPLRHMAQLHAALGASLASFAADARAAAAARAPAAASDTLGPLSSRLRFLRSLLLFHAASEDDVLLPVSRALASRPGDDGDDGGARLSPPASPSPHSGNEAAALASVGSLLADATASARRGGHDAGALAAELAAAADAAAASLTSHMAAEEAGVLPPLLTRVCAGAQRALLWRTLRAMPARVLRRLFPWLAAARGLAAAAALLDDAAPAASPEQAAEVALLRAWVAEGGAEEVDDGGAAAPTAKRPRVSPLQPPTPPVARGDAPIDHIFQFHKALRRDLRAMEAEAAAFAAALDAPGGAGWAPDPAADANGGTAAAGADATDAPPVPTLPEGGAAAPPPRDDSPPDPASRRARRAPVGGALPFSARHLQSALRRRGRRRLPRAGGQGQAAPREPRVHPGPQGGGGDVCGRGARARGAPLRARAARRARRRARTGPLLRRPARVPGDARHVRGAGAVAVVCGALCAGGAGGVGGRDRRADRGGSVGRHPPLGRGRHHPPGSRLHDGLPACRGAGHSVRRVAGQHGGSGSRGGRRARAVRRRLCACCRRARHNNNTSPSAPPPR